MTAETITPQLQAPLDLHQEVAALLPPPLAPETQTQEDLFLDTPLFSAILAEHTYTVTPSLPALFESVAETAAVTEIQQDSPLLAEILVARPEISAQNILEAVKAAKQAEAAMPAPSFGWFEPYDRPASRRPEQQQLPLPMTSEAPRRPRRPSTTAVWRHDGDLETQLASLAYPGVAPILQSRPVIAPQNVATTATAPKSASLFKTLRTKVANGWRRLTGTKSSVPAIPSW